MASVAAAPAVKVARCKRCATILRKARTICPCCNLDVNAPPEEPPPSASRTAAAVGGASASGSRPAPDGGSQKKVRPAAAKSGVKICPICVSTVKEEEMQDYQGKRVCAGCAERMLKTGGSAAAPTPTPAQDQSSGGDSGGGKMSIEAASSATSDMKSYAHLEEKLKKRLYRTKWVLVLFGIGFTILGILTVLGGGLVGLGADAMNDHDVERTMERTDPDFKKLSAEEKQEKIDKTRDVVSGAAWRIKLVGMLLIGVGLFFVVAFFLCNSYPFEISLIALIAYVGMKLFDLSQGFYPGIVGGFIIVAIIGSLIDGCAAGKEIVKLRAEKAANRKPAKA